MQYLRKETKDQSKANQNSHMSLSNSRVLIMNWKYDCIKSKYNHIGLIFGANQKH